ncbi:hypothetical protein V7138_22820 [Bacillus sp. JJ1533]|uniref:hypothetical protein n=1 Tax=Bacillus sp. JJ1533 TaxID=3122959 RepID=UPI002FFF1D02
MSNFKNNLKQPERDEEPDKIVVAKLSKEQWIKILSNCKKEGEIDGVSSLTVKRFIKYYLKEVEFCDFDSII